MFVDSASETALAGATIPATNSAHTGEGNKIKN
jgi:hypothetical protein